MKPGFRLRWAFALVSFYAFITVLFLDGEPREDGAAPPCLAAEIPAPPAYDALLLPRD
jgi:hypothetical protein